jgi:hypothetical protein
MDDESLTCVEGGARVTVATLSSGQVPLLVNFHTLLPSADTWFFGFYSILFLSLGRKCPTIYPRACSFNRISKNLGSTLLLSRNLQDKATRQARQGDQAGTARRSRAGQHKQRRNVGLGGLSHLWLARFKLTPEI